MDKLITLSRAENSPIKDYEIILVTSMEMLSDDEDEEKGADEEEDFDDRDVRNAMKNKRDF